MRRPITPSEAEAILSAYQEGTSVEGVASQLGRAYSTIYGFLSRRNKTRSVQEATRLRGMPVNDHYFSDITTEEQAYWLGFIAADAAVNPSQVVISLARRDREHLCTFRQAINPEATITDYTYEVDGSIYLRSRISICSKPLATDLGRLGVYSGRSFTMKPWVGPNHLMPAYWRGMFDGDGALFQAKTGRWALRLVGTYAVVDAFALFLSSQLSIPRKTPQHHESIWKVCYDRLIDVQAIAKLLYDGAAVCLSRKKEKAEAVAEVLNLRHDWSRTSTDDLLRLHQEFGNWTKVAHHLGTPVSNIRRIRRLHGI